MSHRAERDRKRAARDLLQEQKNAESYSWSVNSSWEQALARAFGVPPWELTWQHFDMTHEYDAYIRLLSPVPDTKPRWDEDKCPKTRAGRVARALERKRECEEEVRRHAEWKARVEKEAPALLEELRKLIDRKPR